MEGVGWKENLWNRLGVVGRGWLALMERAHPHPCVGKNTQLGVRQPGLKSQLCHIKVTKQSHFCISVSPSKWGGDFPGGS